jgi:hypothetical protein
MGGDERGTEKEFNKFGCGAHHNTKTHSVGHTGAWAGIRTYNLSPRRTSNRAIWCSFNPLIDMKPYAVLIELTVTLNAKFLPC